MKKKNKALITGALLTAAYLTHADDPRDKLPCCDEEGLQEEEYCKCYGSAMSGGNDCSGPGKDPSKWTHSCGGHDFENDCDKGEYKVTKVKNCKKERMACKKESEKKKKDAKKSFWERLFSW